MDTKEIRVAIYLEKHGTLEPFEAWDNLGVYRLSAAIFNLKKVGYDIATQLVEVKNRFNETCRIAQYRLIEKGTRPLAKQAAKAKVAKQPKARPVRKETKQAKPGKATIAAVRTKVAAPSPVLVKHQPKPPATRTPIVSMTAPVHALMRPPASRAVPAAADRAMRPSTVNRFSPAAMPRRLVDDDQDDYGSSKGRATTVAGNRY